MYTLKQKIYHWMLGNLPKSIMYRNVDIDNKSSIFVPRFGYSKQQKDQAEEKVNKWLKYFEQE